MLEVRVRAEYRHTAYKYSLSLKDPTTEHICEKMAVIMRYVNPLRR
jgi:hypothetical protein